MPTRSMFRAWRHLSAMSRCSSVRGATYGRSSCGRTRTGGGRALRSTLPWAVSGNRSSTTKVVGHHVVGQARSEARAKLFDGHASAAGMRDVGGQLEFSTRGIVRDDDRPAHAVERLEHGLDLAELHAVATDLDLEVAAAQELDVAVGQVARQVPALVQRAVRPGRGRP